jgi:hypothetical protein
MLAVSRVFLSDLVEAIPAFTQLEPYRDRNFNAWRSKGAHSFHSSTTSWFELQVNSREFGATAFAEAQHLLNHAAEQRAHVLNALSSKGEPSPSWLFVTVYYMALYVAMSWTRSANSAVVYLDRDAIKQYCGPTSRAPAAGAFELRSYLEPSTSICYVRFKKCGSSHFHEAVWIAVHALARRAYEAINLASLGRKATEEECLALRGLNLFQGYQFDSPLYWQSKARNGVNYRPGYSYRSVVKNNIMRTVAKLAKPRFAGIEDAIALGERAKASLRGVKDAFDSIDSCLDLLISQTLVVELITESTLREVCRYHELSSSAFTARESFRRTTRCTSSVIDIPSL